jgi:multisubunit Na+/H+ antiporter MnhG subunit
MTLFAITTIGVYLIFTRFLGVQGNVMIYVGSVLGVASIFFGMVSTIGFSRLRPEQRRGRWASLVQLGIMPLCTGSVILFWMAGAERLMRIAGFAMIACVPIWITLWATSSKRS